MGHALALVYLYPQDAAGGGITSKKQHYVILNLAAINRWSEGFRRPGFVRLTVLTYELKMYYPTRLGYLIVESVDTGLIDVCK
jgi:hypothetical protein